MSDNQFFKPTVLYKEYMILDMIEKNPNITQREMSKTIGVAVSMINSYLDSFEKKGLIKRKKHSTKTVEYFVTRRGSERRKLLNINYLNASLDVFKSAKENIVMFVHQFLEKGYRNIYLYGAGEVAEIFLESISTDNELPIKILGVIDDDLKKQGRFLLKSEIISLSRALDYEHDGILISSYTNRVRMVNNLKLRNYNEKKIIHFFE